MSAEPGAILEGMKKIRKLDRREVPPTANPLRPAEPAPCLTQEEALRNAPEKADGFFAVPIWKDRRGIVALQTGRDDWSSATNTNCMYSEGFYDTRTVDAGRSERVREALNGSP